MPVNFKQNGPAGARPLALIILLVISLACTIVYAREDQDGPIHSVQNVFMSLGSSFGAVGGHAGTAIEGAGTAIQDATADPETLSALREQNEQLRRLVAEAEEYRQEAERLQGLLDMKRVSSVQGKIAHVVSKSDTAWDQSIVIDLGSADGVEPGMTVMGSTGVLGQTARVFDHSSTVRLLTDPNSGAAVKIQSSRADAIVRGSLDGRLHLGELKDDEIPEVGDVVITSGLGGSYQSGLIVGTVVSVSQSANGAPGDIIVNPNDSASLQEEVIVVMDPAVLAKTEEAEAAAAGTSGEADGTATAEASDTSEPIAG